MSRGQASLCYIEPPDPRPDSAVSLCQLPIANLYAELKHARSVLQSRVTISCMAETLTIRLDPEDRTALEMAARGQGKGLSAFVREIAHAEARRVRREAIRADGERVVAHLAEHAATRAELDELGTPQADLA